jgi:hypothetical protein
MCCTLVASLRRRRILDRAQERNTAATVGTARHPVRLNGIDCATVQQGLYGGTVEHIFGLGGPQWSAICTVREAGSKVPPLLWGSALARRIGIKRDTRQPVGSQEMFKAWSTPANSACRPTGFARTTHELVA